jgi:hypothetical protein
VEYENNMLSARILYLPLGLASIPNGPLEQDMTFGVQIINKCACPFEHSFYTLTILV